MIWILLSKDPAHYSTLMHQAQNTQKEPAEKHPTEQQRKQIVKLNVEKGRLPRNQLRITSAQSKLFMDPSQGFDEMVEELEDVSAVWYEEDKAVKTAEAKKARYHPKSQNLRLEGWKCQ